MMISPGTALTGNIASKMSERSFSSKWEKRTFLAMALDRAAIVLASLGTT
jgi:hypothetical protein